MQLLDLTLDTAAENLAVDEALLESAETADRPVEVLRLWELRAPAVIVGRSSHVEIEVDVEACETRHIPIVRRTSGGAAIVAGPGCLMYSLVLSYELRPALRAIDECHRAVLGGVVSALNPLISDLARQGTSDLALGPRKFSGNSLRCRRDHLLYHGTLLYDFPLELIAACLKTPPRQPAYRAGRGHGEFVANVPLGAEALRRALIQHWRADERAAAPDDALVARFVAEKYARREWNWRW